MGNADHQGIFPMSHSHYWQSFLGIGLMSAVKYLQGGGIREKDTILVLPSHTLHSFCNHENQLSKGWLRGGVREGRKDSQSLCPYRSQALYNLPVYLIP